MNKLSLSQAIEQMTALANNPATKLYGSLYSVEDVLRILNNIEAPAPKLQIPPNWVSECAERLVEHIENDFNEFVDFDDAEFQLDRNQLSLQYVGMNSRGAKRTLEMFLAAEEELMEEAYAEVSQEHEVLSNENND